MRIRNESRYPTDEVRKLVRYGMRGLDVQRAVVRVVDATRRAWDGRVHCSGRANGWGVVIRLAPEEYYPYEGWRRHRSSPWNHDFVDWREALVALAAHEGKHLDIPLAYYRRHSQQRVEMACEAYERLVLDRFRQEVA